MDQTASKTSPKDFFLHLLAMIALYASAISFSAVVWQYINLGIPDPLEQYFSADAARSTLRHSLSVLIVFFPTYLATSWTLHKSYLADVSKRNLRVRKWLTYFTLFVAAIIILVDLVSLINTFLNGELTIRFFLKMLTVLFVAGSIFGYYFWDLKKFKFE
ncbi:MAG: DUF5671 domain-containing protein [Patescibacteria group bacterium]